MKVPEHLVSLRYCEFLFICVYLYCVIAINEMNTVLHALYMLRYLCVILFESRALWQRIQCTCWRSNS